MEIGHQSNEVVQSGRAPLRLPVVGVATGTPGGVFTDGGGTEEDKNGSDRPGKLQADGGLFMATSRVLDGVANAVSQWVD